jgi:hypothetical protein
MKWIESTGGPLLILEKVVLSNWGSNNPNGNGQTDYDRACSVEEYIGVINVGYGKTLVLGDVPARTSWFQSKDDKGGLIIRWIYGRSEKQVEEYIENQLPDWNCYVNENIQIKIIKGDMLIWDSAFVYTDKCAEKIEFNIVPGNYRILSGIYEPDIDTKLHIHKMVYNP